MRIELRWLLGLGLGCLLVLACQAQGPLDPFQGGGKYSAQSLGEGEGEDDPVSKKFSDCVLRCEEDREILLSKCLASGIDPEACARKINYGFRLCVEKCRGQCQADCEELRNQEFQRCVDGGHSPEVCADKANELGRRCKIRCRGGIKEDL